MWIATCASVSVRPKCSARTIRVTASRLRRIRFDVVADIFFRFDGSRPIGASMRRPAMHLAPDERDVFLLDLAVAKLARQLFVRRVVLGDHHQPRRAAIEPMHDPGPLLAADAAQIVDVVQQRVDQRAARMAGRRMDDHPGRLVDDDEVVVLVEDRQRQRFGLRHRVDRRRRIDDDLLAALHRLVRLGLAPADADVALLDQPLNLRPRLRRQNETRNRSRRMPSLSSGTVTVWVDIRSRSGDPDEITGDQEVRSSLLKKTS